MPEGPSSMSCFGPGILEVVALLDKYKCSDRVGFESGMSERYGVPSTRKDLFYSNCGTCNSSDSSCMNSNKHNTLPGMHRMSHAS
jgi:hypothetical protein